MYSDVIKLAFEIGQYISDNDIYDDFIEYRVMAFNVLEDKLKKLNIPIDIKKRLNTVIYICRKSETFYEYYLWQRTLSITQKLYDIKVANEKTEKFSKLIDEQISKALICANIKIEQIRKCYKNIINCINLIANEIGYGGPSIITDKFIMDIFNPKVNKSI